MNYQIFITKNTIKVILKNEVKEFNTIKEAEDYIQSLS